MNKQIIQSKTENILGIRIALLRNELGLSQKKFAEKLKLSRNFIALVEVGKKNPSDRTISDICREFNINEEWLKYGIEPIKKTFDDEIAECIGDLLTDDNPLYEIIKNIMRSYKKLDKNSKDVIDSMIQDTINNLNAKKED